MIARIQRPTGDNVQVSNKLNALLKDFLTPPSTAGDPPVADVTNGETIQANPRLTYNLGTHTGLTFIGSTTDNYDLSGVGQSLTVNGDGQITVNDQGYFLNLTLTGAYSAAVTGLNRDLFGHVTLYDTGYGSNRAAAPHLISDGGDGSKLMNSSGQMLVEFSHDSVDLARLQLTVKS
jgi:hypothetical protein